MGTPGAEESRTEGRAWAQAPAHCQTRVGRPLTQWLPRPAQRISDQGKQSGAACLLIRPLARWLACCFREAEEEGETSNKLVINFFFKKKKYLSCSIIPSPLTLSCLH